MIRHTYSLFIVSVLFREADATTIKRHKGFDVASKKVFRQRMENTGDAQYTGVIEVGGQRLKAVMDTGSFELLVLSKSCTVCGTVAHLYDKSVSTSHNGTGFEAEHSFGSGTTKSLEAFDSVMIGNTMINNQVFWEVYDANMALLLEDSFQAIFGIGPPSSAIKFAQEDVDEVHEEFEEFQKKGSAITEKVLSTVQHYEEILQHAKEAKSVVKNMELRHMSVCFGKKSLSDGYIIWNDHATQYHPEKFVEIDVVGDYYWSTEMTNVKFEGDFFKQGGHLGCKEEKCSAVIDSGTTLILAPPDVVDRVDSLLQGFMDKGGTCDDISKLPDLKFKLGGHSFSLPPESYVGQIRGKLSEAIGRYMPHVYARQRLNKHRWGRDCELLLMKMDVDSQSGPLWILGMPLFRKYYTSFKFALGKTGDPQASTMSFAVADDDCQPDTEAAANERLIRIGPRKAQLSVNASKIRIPRLVSRAEKRSIESNKLFPRKPFVRV